MELTGLYRMRTSAHTVALVSCLQGSRQLSPLCSLDKLSTEDEWMRVAAAFCNVTPIRCTTTVVRSFSPRF